MLNDFENCGLITPQEDIAALARAVAYLGEAPICVEVGSWVGYTALAILDANRSAQVHCIDTWLGTPGGDFTGQLAQEMMAKSGQDAVYRAFCRNVREHLFRRCWPHRGDSEFYASIWPFPVDLIFIDADHAYEACRRDIDVWWPHLRSGGIMLGHDFSVDCPGVRRAVKETGPFALAGKTVWYRQKT